MYYNIAADLLKLVLAGVIGFIMGITGTGKILSARLFAITCIGATLICIVSADIFQAVSATRIGDPGRIAAQIISSIGFIGTGLIMKKDRKISGLSVAANLWVTAIIGILIGAGLDQLYVLGTFIVVIIYWLSNVIVEKYQRY